MEFYSLNALIAKANLRRLIETTGGATTLVVVDVATFYPRGYAIYTPAEGTTIE